MISFVFERVFNKPTLLLSSSVALETAIVTNIEELCGKINSTTVGKKTVDTEIEKSNGKIEKKSYDCTNASNKIIIVVPEDPGLKEKIESYVEKAKKY